MPSSRNRIPRKARNGWMKTIRFQLTKKRSLPAPPFAAVVLGLALFLFMVPSDVPAKPDINPKDLLVMARARFGKLSKAEEYLFVNTPLGKPVTMITGDEEKDDPKNAHQWGPERRIRAKCIEWLLLNSVAKSYITDRGVRIYGVRVFESLKLDDVHLTGELFLYGCSTQNISMRNAYLGKMSFINSRIITTKFFECAIEAKKIEVKGDVNLSRLFCYGPVNFAGADIGGKVSCDGSKFYQRSNYYSLNFEGSKIRNGICLSQDFHSKGTVILSNAKINLKISFANAFFDRGSSFFSLQGDEINVDGSILFKDCFSSNGTVRFSSAKVGGSVICDNSTFYTDIGNALDFRASEIYGDVLLNHGFRSKGTINLLNTKINSNLECLKATFNGGDSHRSLWGHGIKVGGEILIKDCFSFDGTVRFSNAKVGGSVIFDNSTFYTDIGDALDFRASEIYGDVLLKHGFRSKGTVNLVKARINSNLECFDATFIGCDYKAAILATNAKIEGSVLYYDRPSSNGTRNFTNVRVGNYFDIYIGDRADRKPFVLELADSIVRILHVRDESVTSNMALGLDGFTYDRLKFGEDRDNPDDGMAEFWINWLSRQSDGCFIPQPYNQAAKVLRNMGYEEAARDILVRKEELRLERDGRMHWLERIWRNGLGLTMDYGHRPYKLIWWVLGFLGCGWFMAWLGRGCFTPIKIGDFQDLVTTGQPSDLKGKYPGFNPLLFSLDSFIPLIDLHQASYWLPMGDASAACQRPEGEPGKLRILVKSLYSLLHRAYHQLGERLPLVSPVGSIINTWRNSLLTFLRRNLRYYFILHSMAGWLLVVLLLAAFTGLIKP